MSKSKPSKERQKEQYDKAQIKDLQPGETLYVIEAKWLKKWEDYCVTPTKNEKKKKSNGKQEGEDGEESDESEPPGEIDNSFITEDSITTTILKQNLQEKYDFAIISAKQWKLLHGWYSGGPEIPRKVVLDGEKREPRVEVYLTRLTIAPTKKETVSPDSANARDIHVSRYTTIQQLQEKIAQDFKLAPGSFRLWNYENDASFSLVECKLTRTLSEEEYASGEIVLFELKFNGKFLLDKKKKSPSFWGWLVGSSSTLPAGKEQDEDEDKKDNERRKKEQSSSSSGSSSSNSGSTTNSSRNTKFNDLPRGCTGLTNLGNTCYMNAAIQCLSNTPLTEFVLSGEYKQQINTRNPLGMKGQIAETYGNLIRAMWADDHASSVTPKTFKSTISKFEPRFEGYNQHDSQELLSFLLDGLHEDLNFVTKKPYVEYPSSDGKSNQELSKIMWDGHLLRNKSKIVDTFQGQLKSTVQCIECKKVSMTFDPFMYLSLPIIEEGKKYIEITFHRINSTEMPKLYAVPVSKSGNVKDIKNSLAQLAGLESHRFALADIVNHRMYLFYKDSAPVSDISSTDKTMCYEMTPKTKNEVYLKILHRRKRKSNSGYSSWDLFGIPQLIFGIQHQTTNKQMYQAVWEKIQFALIEQEEEEEQAQSQEEESSKDNTAAKDDKREKHEEKEESGKDKKSKREKKSEEGQQQEPEKGKQEEDTATTGQQHKKKKHDTSEDKSTNSNNEGSKKKKHSNNNNDDNSTNTDNSNNEKTEKSSKKQKEEGQSPSKQKKENESEQPKDSQKEQQQTTEQQQKKKQKSTFKIDWSDPPFRLCFVTETGSRCFSCSRLDCDGCKINCDDNISEEINEHRELTISVNWKPTAISTIVSKDALSSAHVTKGAKAVREEKLTGRQVQLKDCLALFTTNEKLSENDPWFCPTCKKHCQAFKKFDLWKLPDILVVHLKRFSYTKYSREKITLDVKYPLTELSLSEYVINTDELNTTYNLIGVTSHTGSIGGGHYTAYCLNQNDKNWYHYNDSSVSQVAPHQAQTPNAYVLFFQKQK